MRKIFSDNFRIFFRIALLQDDSICRVILEVFWINNENYLAVLNKYIFHLYSFLRQSKCFKSSIVFFHSRFFIMRTFYPYILKGIGL